MERICSQPGRSKPADGGVTQSEQQSAALALSLGAMPNALLSACLALRAWLRWLLPRLFMVASEALMSPSGSAIRVVGASDALH
jgi:hypothetical protein